MIIGENMKVLKDFESNPPKKVLPHEAALYVLYSILITINSRFWIGPLLIVIVFNVLRYKNSCKLHRLTRIANKTCSAQFKQESNSIIITYLIPNDEIIKEIENL
jgi:hypothetical protein